jgi:hypothetical protein
VAVKEYRLLLLSLVCILGLSFTSTRVHGQNQLLRELAKEDQDQRHGKEVARTDAERVKLVLSQIGQGQLKVLEDYFNAALVLQHTPLAFRDKQVVGTSPDNYLLAHYLFQNALEGGFKDPFTPYLVAASLDRYLSFTEGYQKYGTNRLINQETGKEEWVPIDRKTPDSERAKYGVRPLAELLKQFPEQAPKKPQ